MGGGGGGEGHDGPLGISAINRVTGAKIGTHIGLHDIDKNA